MPEPRPTMTSTSMSAGQSEGSTSTHWLRSRMTVFWSWYRLAIANMAWNSGRITPAAYSRAQELERYLGRGNNNLGTDRGLALENVRIQTLTGSGNAKPRSRSGLEIL